MGVSGGVPLPTQKVIEIFLERVQFLQRIRVSDG